MPDGDKESQIEIRGDGDSIADVWVAGYPFGKLLESLDRRLSEVNARDDAFHELQARVEQLEQDVAARAMPDGGGEPTTKKALAKQITMREALRRGEKAISGGSVDWPTVRDIADRQYETTLNSGTVYAAWDDLVDEWSAFEDQPGEAGPQTKNRRIQLVMSRVSPSLRQACGQQG